MHLGFQRLGHGALAVSLLIITACGSDSKSNKLPTVSATAPANLDERTQATLVVNASDSDGTIASYLWQQQSGPTVGQSSTTEQLVFEVPEVTEDTEISFLVTVTDNDGAEASTTLTTTIIDINQAPVINISNVSVEFNSSVEFELLATDPEGSEVIYTIINLPTSGELTLIDEESQQYRYTPSELSIIDESLTFEASDGELTSVGTINLDIVDTTAPVVTSITPENGAARVPVSSELTLVFDDVMQANSLVNESTNCTGSIQVSHDEFSSCELIESVTASDNDRVFNVSFSNLLQADKNYQIKVTSAATNFHGTAVIESIVASFSTESSNIKISEVSSSYYSDDNRWIEIYNGTSEAVDLSNYVVRTESINLDDYTVAGISEFALPESIVEPGNYVVLQGRTGNGFWQSSFQESEQLVLLGTTEDNLRPLWYANGFIEILNTELTETIDFVRFGENVQEPVSAGHWDADSAAITWEFALGKSLVRDLNHTDTQSSSDWRFSAFITPAGDNDIFCSEDEDLDGIPDCAEIEGSTFAGMSLYDLGARAGVKDIFIEVDYMQSDDPGIIPHKASLQKVVDVFEANGYAVHFDVGSLYHSAEGISHDDFDLGEGNQVPFHLQIGFQSSATAQSVLDIKVRNMDLRRKPVFHYLLMANSQKVDGSGGSSGYAEINGNDLIVSMGNWNLTMDTVENTNLTVNFQSGTIMHELGHNLNLRHGGNEDVNDKPNYLSIMNYLYQLRGLPTIGDREGDRYYRSSFWDNLNCNLEGNTLIKGFTVAPADYLIDFSNGTSAVLNEASIVESQGLGRDTSTSVDFNCNGILDETLVDLDINGDSDATGILTDNDDWSQVNLQFTRTWSGAVSGSEQKNQSNLRRSDIMSNDRQELIKEVAPSSEFFEMIKSLNNKTTTKLND